MVLIITFPISLAIYARGRDAGRWQGGIFLYKDASKRGCYYNNLTTRWAAWSVGGINQQAAKVKRGQNGIDEHICYSYDAVFVMLYKVLHDEQ